MGKGEEDNDRLHAARERVNDRTTFLAFVEALVADRDASVAAEAARPTQFSPSGPGANGWENGSIETYLDAANACARSTGVQADGWLPEEPTWAGFAEFLYVGKIYE